MTPICHNRRLQWTLSLATACYVLVGCAGVGPGGADRADPQSLRAIRVGRFGIACNGYEDPSRFGPPSYSLAEIGRYGVPRLTSLARNLARRIRNHSTSAHLRFAIIPSSASSGDSSGPLKPRLVIFDAKPGPWPGPCRNAAPGYWIMNPGKTTNLYYQPGEDPFRYFAGIWGPTPGPWDRGEADALSG